MDKEQRANLPPRQFHFANFNFNLILLFYVPFLRSIADVAERWGAGVETQKNVRGVFGGWGRVPFNDPYAPSLSTIYDGA